MKLNDVCLFVSTILHSEYITQASFRCSYKVYYFFTMRKGLNSLWAQQKLQ